MKPRSARWVLCVVTTLLIASEPLLETGAFFGTLMAQRRGGGGRSRGRQPNRSSNVKRSSPSRSGSTNRSTQAKRSTSQPSSSDRSAATRGQGSSDRSTAASRSGSSGRSTGASSGRSTGASRSGGASRAGGSKRTVSRSSGRQSSARRGSRNRSRRRYRSRRHRRGRWGHRRFGRWGRWYRGWWVAGVLIRTAAFVAIANSSTTVVVGGTTCYHYNPWYRGELYEGDQVYVLMAAPVGWETDQLPAGADTVELEGTTYYYHEAAFYKDASGGGYVVVEPPVGAEVSSIPEEAKNPGEEEPDLYQFDKTFFTKDTNEAGKQIYRVEPQPPDEELREFPKDAVSFIADDETYYYVNYNLYVAYDENGQQGFVNGEPELGALVENLPEGTTTIEEDGKTYYQFDMVFFEEVEDEDGMLLYEVVGRPGDEEPEELEGG